MDIHEPDHIPHGSSALFRLTQPTYLFEFDDDVHDLRQNFSLKNLKYFMAGKFFSHCDKNR